MTNPYAKAGARLGAAALAALLLTGSALARPDARALTCGEARSLVERSGAAVLTTGQHTYERFVRDFLQCTRDANLHPAWISTRDSSQCFVGYTCRDWSLFGRD